MRHSAKPFAAAGAGGQVVGPLDRPDPESPMAISFGAVDSLNRHTRSTACVERS